MRKQVCVSMKEELIEELDTLVGKKFRSRSHLVEYFCEKGVKEQT